MEEMDEAAFQHCTEEAIDRYNINDCLELFRQLQFLGLTENSAQKKLIKSLELRIITLVIPNDAWSPFGMEARTNRT